MLASGFNYVVKNDKLIPSPSFLLLASINTLINLYEATHIHQLLHEAMQAEHCTGMTQKSRHGTTINYLYTCA